MEVDTPPKNGDWKLIKLFYKYLRHYWPWLILSVIAIPITTLATVGLPLLIVKIIDEYIIPHNYEGLVFMVTLLSGVVFVGYLGDAMYTYSLQRTGQLAITKLRIDAFSHALTLPRRYFDKHPIGVTLSRLTSDMEAIGESLAIGVLSLITDFIKTIGLLIFLFYLSWKLTFLILLVLPPIYFVVSILRKKLRLFFNTSREAIAEATAYLQECLNGMKIVQLYAAENITLARFKKRNKKFFVAQVRSNTYDAALYSVIDGLTTITMILLIWVGTGQILSSTITIGVLIGFINTLNRIFIPIREFAQQIALIQRALSALEHINELFEQEPDEKKLVIDSTSNIQLKEFKKLEFNNVSFRYSPEGPWVLNNISFTMKKGDRFAIVGATGSGKSTIIKLLTKSYKDYTGSIKINGIELTLIPKASLSNAFSLMQQDVYLFNESIHFNISLFRDGIGDAEVEDAAEYVFANEFIEEFADNYQYKIRDNGNNISAGQAQLISFARAIAGESEMILMDEATASIDSVTENLIQKAIERILVEKTVITIAHRLSTIRSSDKILVLKEGAIIEQGNHNSLIKEKGYYLELLSKFETDSEDKSSQVAS